MRGLKAPPRRTVAPDALTAFAMPTICSSDSTEQGPAISVRFPPPIVTSPTFTTVSSGWNLRFAFLYGSCTRLTSSTMSSDAIRSISSDEVSPISPRIVCLEPTVGCTSIFCSLSHFIRPSNCSLSGLSFSITIISLLLSVCAVLIRKKALQSMDCRAYICLLFPFFSHTDKTLPCKR